MESVELSGSGTVKRNTIERVIAARKRNRRVSITQKLILVWIGLAILIMAGLLISDIMPKTMPDLISDVRASVVHIAKVGKCQGSGVAVTESIVMTARHVTDGVPGEYVITLDDGSTAKVLAVVEDTRNDIAYLLTDRDDLEPADIASKNPMPGESVVVFGSPLGFQQINTASPGYVTALNRDLCSAVRGHEEEKYEWRQMIQSNAPAYPGNSGGPVFNMDGKIAGVLVAGVDATLNWSVPAERINNNLRYVEMQLVRAMLDDLFPILHDIEVEDVSYDPYQYFKEGR